jgi:cytochrome c5
MNAPAVGDKDAWAPRIEAGMATLVDHVANGFGNMPPQGGQASEEEIRAALTWMIEEETGLQIPQQ